MNMRTDATVELEVRCPVGSRNLLMKLRTDPDASLGVNSDNLLCLMCRDCTKYARREMQRAGLDNTSFRIVHQFNFLGEHISTTREPV